jgi:lipopolysaccharide export LptBFGC system permease protein LptF
VPAAERRAAELWWQLTEGRPATFRLRGLDLQLGDGTVLRFARYDEAADVLLDVRVTRSEGALLAVTRAARAHWDEGGLRLEGATRTRLDLAALDRGLDAAATLAALVDGPTPLEALALPEARSETVARYSGGTVGDGRSLTRRYQVARDPGSAYGARRWAAFALHERIAAAFAPLVLTFGAVVIGLRSAPSVLVAFAVSASVGIGWFVLAALGHWLVVSQLLPPWLGAWLAQLVVLCVSAVAVSRR